MTTSQHGLSIGIERIDNTFYLSLTAKGKLSHHDYEIINPIIDSALSTIKHPKVKMIFNAAELEGWEPRAAWDDFKLGLQHGNEFEKIAIFGNKSWLEISAKIGNWFLTGEIKYFESQGEAITWLIN